MSVKRAEIREILQNEENEAIESGFERLLQIERRNGR
jgi:hypothetical protein